MATYSVNWSAVLSSTSGTVTVGLALCMSSNGTHFIATTANRTSYGRTVGIAATAGDITTPVVQMIEAGIIPASITGLAVGTVSWVRVSATGTLERCTPSAGDDLVGQCHADGSLQFTPGVFDSSNYAGGGGGGSTSVTGTGFWHNTTGTLDAAATALTFTGDTTGTGTGASIALTTVKINGATVPAAGALTTGNLLGVTGTGALSYGALNLAGGSNYVTGILPVANTGAPSGTGYPHVTSGAYDAAAVALTWTGDATGTGTGSSFALTVVKVNGASVPAAGALTTGNSAYVSGASALTYSALNLAGGSGWVTGVLPAANQASQAMAGDVTGTTAASVVAKVNGTTYPAGGALTTGTIPRVTAAATVAYGALDLANASAVTGVLPTGNQASQTMAGDVTGTTAASVVAKINGASVIAAGALTTGHVLKVTSVSSTTYGFVADANVASGAAIAASKVVQATGTGFPHVTSGVLDAASIKVDVTNSAHVTVPATANGVVTSSGSVLQQAANVLAGSGFISIGATPSAAGDVRMQGVSAIKAIRAGTDYNVLNISLGSFIDIGDSAGSEFISARPGAGGIFRVLSGAAAFEAFTVTETQVQAGYPIVGTINNTSPYSVHAKTTVSTAGTHTMTATEYSPDAIMFSASTGGTYTFPLPASDAGAYYKTIIYTGNSSAVITNGGGAPKNVTVSPNTTMRCLFDTAGVHPLSGSAGAYP